MKQEINYEQFSDAFTMAGRNDNFSIAGRRALFDYLEQLEEDLGEDIELDVIALCCDFTESSIEDALANYSLETLEELQDNTQVIEVDDETIIYINY
jgi:hypothetical protein